ncbi:MAG: dihydroorotate dehydrogenase [Deltaproteobacteria bacterium]|nr:dihydroorotate dehydrogenase [Deltaproteobacteria bacterium]MBW2479382.1 dihydroorotate dehydrogenase [Deltaproteobacteria bacterium]
MTVKPDMRVDLGGIQLQNPVMTASGTFGYGREFDHLIDLNRLGGIIVKGLSLLPSRGNPPPRIVETACGMINAIGLENVGIERFIAEKLPFLQDLNPPLLVNIYGKVQEDYHQLAARIDEEAAIDGIEVNISCPNVKAGGMAFGVDPQAAFDVIRAVRSQTSKLVIVKLSPNVTDITEIAAAVEEAGADGISLINTISAMAVDVNTRRPKIANIIGGLSGPAIKPVALRMVWQVAQKSKLPIIGIGGIMTAEDALEFLITGATAIEVGTANFVNPRVTIDIIDGIEAFLTDHGIASVMDIIGTLET